jgi:hypothetical protein
MTSTPSALTGAALPVAANEIPEIEEFLVTYYDLTTRNKSASVSVSCAPHGDKTPTARNHASAILCKRTSRATG